MTTREDILSLAVPDGWKLVPIAPTREMCLAARHETATYPVRADATSPVVVYRAMLAAAPTPPAAEAPQGQAPSQADLAGLRADCAGEQGE